jgi:hypothetical protein
MGLLDDAIREHLDLKRRRGADPEEVERAEREALGPVRRGREEPEDDEVGHDPGVDPGPAYDHEEEEDWGGEVSEDEPDGPRKKGRKFFSRRSKSAPEPDFYEEPPDDDEPRAPREDPALQEPTSRRASAPAPPPSSEPPASGELDVADAAEPEAHPPTTGPARPASEHAGGETVEYDVEGALEANKTDEGEDVLEETPEFLQDTPDHDRLWFEQRPPRDFDFDG